MAMRRALQLGIRVRSKLAPVKLKSKGMARRIVGGVARDVGLVMCQLDILEPDLFAVEIRSELKRSTGSP